MPQVLTVSCKLVVLPQQVEKLEAVLMAFSRCCEYVNANTPKNLANQIAVQSLIYKSARAESGLSSQLTIHAIRRVCANRKTARHKGEAVKGFAATSATYDSRTFSFREEDWSVTLTMLKGRERFALHIGNYQRGLLNGTNPKAATLCKRNDGTYYLQVQLHSAQIHTQNLFRVLGVDLGRTDIAVTSEGEAFSGKHVTHLRDKFCQIRDSLYKKASKGTRSTRRRCRQTLQRLSGRERRFQANINHTISFRLIHQAMVNHWAIALEDLTGIRERTNQVPRTKTERRRSNGWAFFQLRTFLLYKGIKFGVRVYLVDPRYTSKSCHCCGVLGDRKGKSFRCLNLSCGWKGDADWNGSLNIAKLGAAINQPGGPSTLFCSSQDAVLRAAENSVL